MLAAIRPVEPLPAGHPCQGCEVRSTALCSSLDCGDLARFRKLGGSVGLRPGQTLFLEGDPAARVYTLTSGALKIYALLADGRRQITGFLFPGDFLGIGIEDAHAFTADALEDSRLCWFAKERFDDFLADHPSMERALYCRAARELAAAQKQLVLLGRKTAMERLSSFLLTLADRPVAASGRPARHVHLAMSRSDIADYLGLTKETVSRVLSELRRERVIRLDAIDRIEILARHALECRAEAGT